MFLFIRNLAVSCILMIMSAIGLFLLAATRATAQVSMTRTLKGSSAEVQYLAVFGRWELRSSLTQWGRTVSLCRRSDTMLIIGPASTFTETIGTETDPRLPVV